ncbi:MAG: response regulator [Rhodobacteraceae bacterium]|nr:response regulator [Paracoccaceae bacterium]
MSERPLILVCDDDQLLLELMEFRLRAKEFGVVLAEDGRKALDLVSARHPDLIVLDAMMPGMDGLEVLLRLKQAEATRDIPVIMLTARKSESDIVKALEAGAADYIIKPFMPDELVVRIQKALSG